MIVDTKLIYQDKMMWVTRRTTDGFKAKPVTIYEHWVQWQNRVRSKMVSQVGRKIEVSYDSL